MPTHFLMQQMEWREALEDASSAQALETLRQNVEHSKQDLLNQCAQFLDVQGNRSAAVQPVRELMFIEKFALDLDRAFDKFE
jgi:molecular chaperone HscB